jgi:SAM-dependent methyltransferase
MYVVDSLDDRGPSSYDDFYTEEKLAVPDFIDGILDGIVAEFETFRSNNRLLDVGTGAGGFVKAAGRAGWEAEAVEVSKSSVDYLRKEGIKVFHGTLEAASYLPDSFDVVTLSEVIEHVPAPREMAIDICRILRPGGLLWGSTPHGRGVSARTIGPEWSAVCPPDHLQLFSVRGIKQMLLRAGFSKVKIQTHGVNPFELISVMRKRLRNSCVPNPSAKSCDVLGSSYQLNESLSRDARRKTIKSILNHILSGLRLGDSIKFWAVK